MSRCQSDGNGVARLGCGVLVYSQVHLTCTILTQAPLEIREGTHSLHATTHRSHVNLFIYIPVTEGDVIVNCLSTAIALAP